MKTLRRFLNCLRLNLRPIVLKNPLLFLLILAQMTMLFYSVDIAISSALKHYDFVGAYFDDTAHSYMALSLKSTYTNTLSSADGQQALWQEMYNACGEPPLCAHSSTPIDENTVAFEYSPELFGIERPMQTGRWLTAEDADTYGCVVSAELAEQYPIGSIIPYSILAGGWAEGENGGWLHETRDYRVVGVLAEGEVPLASHQQLNTNSLSTLMYLDYGRPFVIFPADYQRYFAGLTVWFRTDRSTQEMQELLKDYGTVIPQEQLVTTYQQNALNEVFLETPHMLILLAVSLVLMLSVMVMSFGRNRRHWSVLYLLGQSQRMLIGCIAAIYTAVTLLAYGLSRLWITLDGSVSISVAQGVTVGVMLLAILCIGGVVGAFFRHSPMELFADNK